MLDIILIFVLTMIAFAIYVFYTKKKHLLLNELATCYNEATNLLQSCTSEKTPLELIKVLNDHLRELAAYLNKLDADIHSQLAIFRLRQIFREDCPLIEAKTREIKGICSQWNKYVAFKKQLTDDLSDIINLNNELNDKMLALVRYDKNLEDLVQAKAAGVLSQLEDYQKQFRELLRLGFENFTSDDAYPAISESFLAQANTLINEFKFYKTPLKVVITGLFRKSIYYITLEDSTVKSLRRHSGTVQVSYKTFRDMQKGNAYKRDIVVGNKHVSSEQNVTIKSYKGDIETKITYKLSKEQFKELFQALKFNRKFEETDEDEIPYQINALDLDVVVCEKKANNFEIIYNLDIFRGIPVYDFLSYNRSGLELTFELPPATDSISPDESAEAGPSEQPEDISYAEADISAEAAVSCTE